MSLLVAFARKELELAGAFDKDGDYGGMLGDAVMKMVEQFADEGHSGYSARLALQTFERVASFEPLTPLTGADDEWNEVGDGVWQNRRCSHVFKEADGAYDITAVIFREPDGSCYSSGGSRAAITFPYTPKQTILDVEGRAPAQAIETEGGDALAAPSRSDESAVATIGSDAPPPPSESPLP